MSELRSAVEELIEIGAIPCKPDFETLIWVARVAQDTDGSQTNIVYDACKEL